MRKDSFLLRNRFIKELKNRRLTVAFAESMTCGLAMQKLSRVKGTMQVLQGGVVCYREEVKTKLLHVSPNMLQKHTAESPEVTAQLALSLSKLVKADLHAAVTGLAAPGGSETKTKPVGTVFIAVRYKRKTFAERRLLKGTPKEIMEKACDAVYLFILQVVTKQITSP